MPSRSLAIVIFDNEDDYRKGDEILGVDAGVRHAGQSHGGHEVPRRDTG